LDKTDGHSLSVLSWQRRIGAFKSRMGGDNRTFNVDTKRRGETAKELRIEKEL
jgi:hypothetical protein